ncbi:acyclic terpene utilization AtuA family protein [Desmospora activa]|uniref:Uncharacterized protein DUF1446 n=1 Tax=Desmospora activa DSM 45169 TaxID=1121389 RepID=A0A2T4Z9B7_9BACL|nr:acyclic terpene utilization AtuA family protein [Desmospora activa]PTM58482.1 uncharacterized protein DUF1446 [Desmospora activa DSM 45169]
MLRIGVGAGFSGDRIEPAQELLKLTQLDYLVLECLSERTIAIAQKMKRQNCDWGYDPLLEKRITALLPLLKQKKVRLITNMGAANPHGAAAKILAIAQALQIPCKVAAVSGDDVLEQVDPHDSILENGKRIVDYQPLISANAYLGVDALLPALKSDADIIVTGRVADPSLFLAPMVHHYGWALDDVDRLAQGAIVGHLLECAGQITGGYYAEPGRKAVPGMAHLGFPFALIEEDGTATITKPNETGGVVNLHTVKEQLLYEIGDPTEYITPDVIADLSKVELEEVKPNHVRVKGGRGTGRPEQLKVSLGYHAGYLGEGEISYAGSTAVERAQLAKAILLERLQAEYPRLQVDLIGCSALHRTQWGEQRPYEVRVRAAALCRERESAARIGQEVEALYTNGPFGGGGARKYESEMIGVVSTLIPRTKVNVDIQFKEWRP